jgi:hypothetical protein
MKSHQTELPPDWADWTRAKILMALSKTEWRTFAEVLARLPAERPSWMGGVIVRGFIRKFVQNKWVEVRIRRMVGVRQGRGPDEFRRVR